MNSFTSQSDSDSSGSVSNGISAISEYCVDGTSVVDAAEKRSYSNFSAGDFTQNIICSTEDEATSIYSDVEDNTPIYSSAPSNMLGKGTFIVRKGRKERQQLPELFLAPKSPTPLQSLLSGSYTMDEISYRTQNHLFSPNSRHSIDLGASRQSSQQRKTKASLSPR